MKKIKRLYNLIVIFFIGFDYSIRHTINPDNHYSWSASRTENKVYRSGIKIGSTYKYYKAEFIALLLIAFCIILIMTM